MAPIFVTAATHEDRAHAQSRQRQSLPRWRERSLRLNIFARILLGAITGWLTGKIADGERAGRGSSPGSNQLRDVICGVIGGLVGHSLFFWVIIGSSSFGNYATAVLGAILVVGAARLIGARLQRTRRTAH